MKYIFLEAETLEVNWRTCFCTKFLRKKKQVIPACWSEFWHSSSFSEKFTDTYKTADFTVNTEKRVQPQTFTPKLGMYTQCILAM